MKKIFVLIAIMFGLMQSAQAVIITNGDFSTDASGWSTSAAFGGYSADDGNPAGSFLLNGGGSTSSDPWISQTVSGLTIGAIYDLSWDLLLHADWNGSSANGLSFGVFLNGDVIDLSQQLTNDWVSDQVSFTAFDKSLTLMFAAELDNRTPGVNGTTDVSYYIDNISLTQQIDNGPGGGVPEPATLLLLAVGLTGFGFSGWYKKQV
ncbi:hypothetical protein MNBD_GAMMA24-2628 [hydrothermal vent metagenome]|uniref:Ice-binding protein C-terminal domain-containing protein n=1 Tax=hydrothermal vent metagenome TaxID=652676 RepID=A0A3B1B8T3_9ZZZZ